MSATQQFAGEVQMLEATQGQERRSRAGLRLLLSLALLAGAPAWGQGAPSEVGQWSPLMPWPDTGTHAVVLADGKVLTWTERELEPFNVWDPGTGARTTVPHPGFNSFCSGHATLADGRLLVAGGYIETDVGPQRAGIYDPKTGSWTQLPDMNAGRYYPTATALSNGEVLVIAGTATKQALGENKLPQVWQPDKNAWRDLTGAQRVMRTYPWMFVAPNGKVFKAGPEAQTLYLDTSGLGAWTPVATSLSGERRYGSAVMYEPGKVMISGGIGKGINSPTVEVIDLNAPAPAWRSVQPMAQPRVQHTMTLLPDGKVLVTGGSSGPGKSDDTHPVHTPELWDPATERFTPLAPDLQYRGYHSTAILLPDARVLSVGGEKTKDAQIYSPPYLFRGARPTITSSPPSVRYGESFSVGTPDAASITQVTWVRPGAATHAFNQDQRFNQLGFSREAGGVRVTAPASANLAPAGMYMLFLLNAQGVPSQGRWVQVSGPDAQPAAEVPAITPGEGWKYDDRGVEPDASWTTTSFDDAQWKSGLGGFSSDDGQATTLQLAEQQSTVYFRKKVVLRGAASGGRLVVQAGDGVSVWLNGNRVLHVNVEEGTSPSSWATGPAPDGGRSEVTLPTGVLVDGENQLAVMVKRARGSTTVPNPQLRFGLELFANLSGQVEPVPVLALQAPNGGEALEGGSPVQIAWRTFGNVSEVKLEYSQDGGVRWEPIAEGLANTGSHVWQAPPLSSSQVRVRVSGASGLASADTSDAPFTLRATGAGPGEACDAAGTGGLQSCQSDAPRRKAGGCAAGGSTPAGIGLLLALLHALRRQPHRGGRCRTGRAQ